MNHLENNKLIAEFMGHKDILNGIYDIPVPEHLNGIGYIIEKMEYHTSWDWLMPVVDKIEITSVDGEDNSDEFFNVVIEVFECNINGSGRTVCGVGQNKIEATYKAVVEFIKWYNKNK